jgi:hypothetical protein
MMGKIRAILGALCVLACAGAAPAQDAGALSGPCRLALLLATDVSSSVDAREHDLQRAGLARALTAPAVRAAVLAGPGPVALAAYEWSGRRQHRLTVDWTLVSDAATLERIAARIAAAPRSHSRFPTAMGFALGYGHTLMRRAPECRRQVIDLSGDGITNDGFGPLLAYKHFDFGAITVNGLAIEGADAEVVAYFEREVAHGPLAFVEIAASYADFERAMTRKLVRELSEVIVGEAPPRPPPRGTRRLVACAAAPMIAPCAR